MSKPENAIAAPIKTEDLSEADAAPSRRGRVVKGGAAIGAVIALAVLAGCNTGESNAEPTGPTAGTMAPAPESGTTLASAPPSTTQVETTPTGAMHTEIADHKPALQLYANNQGTLMNGDLPLGTSVSVECVAPNDSGMGSADPGFYKFEWHDDVVYAITNEFANGDPVGVDGYNTVVDPSVPKC